RLSGDGRAGRDSSADPLMPEQTGRAVDAPPRPRAPADLAAGPPAYPLCWSPQLPRGSPMSAAPPPPDFPPPARLPLLGRPGRRLARAAGGAPSDGTGVADLLPRPDYPTSGRVGQADALLDTTSASP